jgi:hypothetical protein
MTNVLLMAVLLAVLGPPPLHLASPGTADVAARVKDLEACRVGLTAAGQTAAFAGTAVFEMTIGADGVVSRIRTLKMPEVFEAFVEISKFDACMRRWRFSGAGSVPVVFTAGTTGEALTAWSITVGTPPNSVRLVLPRL